MQNVQFLKFDPEWMSYEGVAPAVKVLPDWYKSLDKYESGHPGLKACSPFFDALSAGYVMLTPCDIEFYKNGDRVSARVAEAQYSHFINERSPEQIVPFPEVHGHSLHHFDWWPMWGEKLPSGFSGLYVHPLNRYDLPFMTTNGIVDNDKFHVPGRFPFFIRDGFTGILPKGTPFIQFIPFERQDWSLEIVQLSDEEGKAMTDAAYEEYRQVGHSGYRKNKWVPKRFS